MKVLGLFVLCFGVLSLLPFLWNGFQFVELGFPFVYIKRSVVDIPRYSQFVNLYNWPFLIYDLVLVAAFMWLFDRIKRVVKP
jgi:hypothetical protein